jgi:hypothetical protein
MKAVTLAAEWLEHEEWKNMKRAAQNQVLAGVDKVKREKPNHRGERSVRSPSTTTRTFPRQAAPVATHTPSTSIPRPAMAHHRCSPWRCSSPSVAHAIPVSLNTIHLIPSSPPRPPLLPRLPAKTHHRATASGEGRVAVVLLPAAAKTLMLTRTSTTLLRARNTLVHWYTGH